MLVEEAEGGERHLTKSPRTTSPESQIDYDKMVARQIHEEEVR